MTREKAVLERILVLHITPSVFQISSSHKLYLIVDSKMNPQHSTLEHIRHDETAEALQRDYDTIAAELDTDASAPQADMPYCKA